jgi:hypothetical protein
LAEQAGVSHETARLTVIAAGKNAAELMSAYAEPVINEWRKAIEAASARGDHRPRRTGSSTRVCSINFPMQGKAPPSHHPELTTRCQGCRVGAKRWRQVGQVGPPTIEGEKVREPTVAV